MLTADCLTNKLKGSKDVLYKLMDSCSSHVRPSKQSGRKERASTEQSGH